MEKKATNSDLLNKTNEDNNTIVIFGTPDGNVGIFEDCEIDF